MGYLPSVLVCRIIFDDKIFHVLIFLFVVLSFSYSASFLGAVELVDVSHELPGLKRQPGMTTWKVGGMR